MPAHRSFFILTFGCQMNVYDSGRLRSLLVGNGWVEAASGEEARFIFLNTCSIREKAANRVIVRLRELGPLKKKNPGLIIAVGGCVAEQEGVDLLGKAPMVDLVVGPRRLSEIPPLLNSWKPGTGPLVLSGDPPENPLRPRDDAPFGEYPVRPADSPERSPVSAFVTIMEGCDNHCAYCVVPRLRGRERSRSREDVLREVRALAAGGTREVTLLGQNVNSWGSGGPASAPRRPEPFPALLREAAEIPGVLRLRFTTSHPKDTSDELAELFGTLDKLCPHIHLPLQSGSDRVLSLMGRRYSRERYLSVAKALRAARPGIAITSDIIVGFPGETEEDFRKTMETLEESRFDSVFSFKYSDRPGTKAPSFPGKVPEEVKGRRLEELIKLQKKISLSVNAGLLGTDEEVLVEGPGREPSQLSGRTGTFKIVNFAIPPGFPDEDPKRPSESDPAADPAAVVPPGSLVAVTVTGTGPVSLKGTLKRILDIPHRPARAARERI
ncbi:MAG: tRNA (N6-isopentenyl adenosine(37)-C2)-methylthiotransferase MiaB [Deltaproteobacteria bacterium]|jgi:tRNA-2-methylthio-N6-dimethylallyladenosine synthase|nr:tRNA (N6-isopentenyl adenosine(37)-C2)-methylthiotransferase MiaB [Deltaproteobacteria bacterium]